MMEIEKLSVEECGGERGRGLAYLGTLEVRLGGTASDALFWLEICKSSPATAVDDLMFSSSLGSSPFGAGMLLYMCTASRFLFVMGYGPTLSCQQNRSLSPFQLGCRRDAR